MRNRFIFLVFLVLLQTGTKGQHTYKLISYLDINVDSLGNLSRNPYVVNLSSKNKHLLVVGTQHSRDTLNKMFADIEQLFSKFKPDVVINEGGRLTKKYASVNEAIFKDGELGLEKFLADKKGISTVNGDMNDSLEFEQLSAAYSREEALIFFASERFIFPYAFGQYSGDLEQLYDSIFIKKYLLKEGIKLSAAERRFDYYTTGYKKYFHEEFSLDNINQLNFTPFGTRHHFNEVTRKSKEIRDIALLQTIEAELKQHDKVLVIFGGWHVLAVELALTEIINRVK